MTQMNTDLFNAQTSQLNFSPSKIGPEAFWNVPAQNPEKRLLAIQGPDGFFGRNVLGQIRSSLHGYGRSTWRKFVHVHSPRNFPAVHAMRIGVKEKMTGTCSVECQVVRLVVGITRQKRAAFCVVGDAVDRFLHGRRRMEVFA